jgi:hypothetical protein
MNKKRFTTAAALISLAFGALGSAHAQIKVEPLNVKTGLWEATMTTTTSGAAPIPAELLSRLTPEQRAKMEEGAKVKASFASKTRTITSKSCVTREQLEKGFGHE